MSRAALERSVRASVAALGSPQVGATDAEEVVHSLPTGDEVGATSAEAAGTVVNRQHSRLRPLESSDDDLPTTSQRHSASRRQKYIECPVCIEVYQRPKSLTCGHSLCAVCEGRLTTDERRINCPVCRVPTEVPREGLPINYSLQDVISKLTQKKITPSNKLHPCPVCSVARPIGEFWLCQHPGDQCANRTGRIACSCCALKLHKNHDLMEVAEILNRREQAAADWKTKVSAKLQRLSSASNASGAFVLECELRLSNAVSTLVAQLKTSVSAQMQRRKEALEAAVAQLQSDLENFAKVDELCLQLSSINGVEDLLADEMMDAKQRELDQQMRNQEKFRQDSNAVVRLVSDTITRLTALIETTDGQAAGGPIDGEGGDDPGRRHADVHSLPTVGDEVGATSAEAAGTVVNRQHSRLRPLESSDDDQPTTSRRHSAARVISSSDSDGSVVLPLRERIQRRRVGAATSTLSPIADTSRPSIDSDNSDISSDNSDISSYMVISSDND